jgi:hypothetical protein
MKKLGAFFARFIAAIQESRMKQAEREIAMYIARTGGRLTDETERDISRILLARTV